MSFTQIQVSELVNRLASRLRDVSEEKFTSSSGIKLEAINSAILDVVFYINSIVSKSNASNLLKRLQYKDSISIPSSGYSIDNLTNKYFTILPAFAYPASVSSKKYCTIRDTDKLGLSDNMYLQGNSEYPVIYILNNTIYIDVDFGDYPVDVDFYYLRLPKKHVISSPSTYETIYFELGEEFVNLVLDIAAVYCYDSSADYASRDIYVKDYINKFLLIKGINKARLKESSVGQASRESNDDNNFLSQNIQLDTGLLS